MDTKAFLEKIGKTIDAKDSAGFADFITEDGQFRFANYPSAHGRENIIKAVDDFFKTIKSSQHSITKFWQDDSSIVWQGEVLYTRLDGNKLTLKFVNIFNMSDDKIKDYLIYIDNTPLYADMPEV
jgi:hypothetical protein